ncbi:unnamed protein product [Calypogeia fissa]
MPSSLGELFNSEDGTLGEKPPYMGNVEAIMMAQGHGGGNVDESAMRGLGDARIANSTSDQQARVQKPTPQQLELTWTPRQRGRLTGPDTKHGDKGNSSKASAGSNLTETQQNRQDGGQGLTNHNASLEAVTKKLKQKEAEVVKLLQKERDHHWLQLHTNKVEADNKELQDKLKQMELEYSKISESGAYNHNSATPTDVSKAFSKIFPGVFALRGLAKFMPEHKKSEMKAKFSKSMFLRDSHFPDLTLTAEVVSILFEGFENESFMDGGYSVYLDPLVRKHEFFDLFQKNAHESREFVEYYNRRKARVVETLGMEDAMTDQQLTGLLDLEFRKAAQNVWALHLLCFAFDPPASIFRVRAGAGFEREYMETPPNLEVDEDSLKEVAFMLVPGLRIDKFSTIKSSIYPLLKS